MLIRLRDNLCGGTRRSAPRPRSRPRPRVVQSSRTRTRTRTKRRVVKQPDKQGTLDVGRWTLDVGCWMLDVGCWMLDVGCRMLDVEYFSTLVFLVQTTTPRRGRI